MVIEIKRQNYNGLFLLDDGLLQLLPRVIIPTPIIGFISKRISPMKTHHHAQIIPLSWALGVLIGDYLEDIARLQFVSGYCIVRHSVHLLNLIASVEASEVRIVKLMAGIFAFRTIDFIEYTLIIRLHRAVIEGFATLRAFPCFLAFSGLVNIKENLIAILTFDGYILGLLPLFPVAHDHYLMPYVASQIVVS
jgi:hypothetical protein